MPVIYIDKEGNLVKEGSNGCVTCGHPECNKEVLVEAVIEEPKTETLTIKKSKKQSKEVTENVD